MIDKAFFITTKPDKQIRRKIEHIKNSLGCSEDFIEVLRNKRNSTNPIKGCFDAHMNAYREVVRRGYQSALIFEDDVHFLRPLDIGRLNELLKKLAFDLFYLGHRPVFKQDTWMKAIEIAGTFQVRTNDRHAFVISGEYAKKVIGMPWAGKNGDVILRNNAENAFALYPMVAIQTGSVGSQSFKNGFSELVNEYIQVSRLKQFPFSFVFRVGLPFYSIQVLLRLIWIRIKQY